MGSLCLGRHCSSRLRTESRYLHRTITSYRVGDRTFSLKHCRYLHLNGADEVSIAGSFTCCPPLKNQSETYRLLGTYLLSKEPRSWQPGRGFFQFGGQSSVIASPAHARWRRTGYVCCRGETVAEKIKLKRSEAWFHCQARTTLNPFEGLERRSRLGYRLALSRDRFALEDCQPLLYYAALVQPVQPVNLFWRLEGKYLSRAVPVFLLVGSKKIRQVGQLGRVVAAQALPTSDLSNLPSDLSRGGQQTRARNWRNGL
jgi:hypothetical protein